MTFNANVFISLDDRTSVAVMAGVLHLLQDLERLLGPCGLRLGEDEPIEPLSSVDESTYTTSETGFLVCGGGWSGNVTRDRPPGETEVDGLRATLWFEDPTDQMLNCVLNTITCAAGSLSVVCAYGGHEDEVKHHLFARVKAGKSTVESFLGRNHRKYVAGLFTWNLWSQRWLSERETPLAEPPVPWRKATLDSNELSYFEVRRDGPWSAWHKHVAAAEGWADSQEGVFSMREVHDVMPEGLDALSVVSFLRRWK